MFLLYNLLLTFLAPIWGVWMLIRTRARKEPPNWAQRFGQYDIQPRMDRKRIWIHAVSVGEVVAAKPVLQALRKELPDFELVLSVTTSSGHRTALEAKYVSRQSDPTQQAEFPTPPPSEGEGQGRGGRLGSTGGSEVQSSSDRALRSEPAGSAPSPLPPSLQGRGVESGAQGEVVPVNASPENPTDPTQQASSSTPPPSEGEGQGRGGGLGSTGGSEVQSSSDRALSSEPPLYDHLVYFPIDVLRFSLGAIQRVQPAVVAIMETELWMNFLWSAKTFDCRTMLINGRISDRSFRRGRWLQFFYASVLRYMDRCLMQTETSADRIRFLGATSAEVFGSTKFDQAGEVLAADRAGQRSKFGVQEGDFVVVVGSTRSELEERLVLDALLDLPVKVIHAPRHLERVEALAQEVARRGKSASCWSKGETGDYLILDTYGELAEAYAGADLAIVGGGFDDLGGQNLIQALAAGVPVIHGPHMQNFREAAEESARVGATLVAKDADELRTAVHRLQADAFRRHQMGEAGRALVLANQGAAERYARAIAEEAAKVPIRTPRKRPDAG